MRHPFGFRQLLPVALAACVSLCFAAPQDTKQEPLPATVISKKLLSSRYDSTLLAAKWVPLKEWSFFPPAEDRAAWEKLLAQPLNQTRKAWIVPQAEALLGKAWPALPATLYMECARNGNRSNFEDPYFARRLNLATLVMAECLEHKGRFLDEIANGLWAICEESTWCLPAHAVTQPKDPLQRLDPPTIDLFAAETAMTLATTRHLLRSELDRLSPSLGERVRLEVLRRVVVPVETTDDFGRSETWFSGIYNNWTPWCSANVLGSAMLLVDDNQRIARLSTRLMGAVDHFLDVYGDDGGCDEGPVYWNNAAGSLCLFLELLYSRTNGEINPYTEPKIAAMGKYITHVQISDWWFVNFSDADAKTTPSVGKLYRYGERVGSEAMKNMALLAQRKWQAGGPVNPPLLMNKISQPLLGPLIQLFWMPSQATPVASAEALEHWFPDLQVLVAREGTNPRKGLFLAAKGGHNAESHNHNDSGHFIVYLDGQPGIIDLGRETYTAQTFGEQRYELLFTRGFGHNAPVVGGVEQAAGREYLATELSYRQGSAGPSLGMNLEKAYPNSAGIQSLRRELELQRAGEARVRLRDSMTLRQEDAEILLPFYAAFPAELVRPGLLSIATKPRKLLLSFDPDVFRVAIEIHPLKDKLMQDNWGERLWRIAFETKAVAGKRDYSLTFRAEGSDTSAAAPSKSLDSRRQTHDEAASTR